MTTQTIRVQVKSVYGEDKFYPACPQAQMFADIAGTKTLTEATLRILIRAGWEVKQQHVELAIAA